MNSLIKFVSPIKGLLAVSFVLCFFTASGQNNCSKMQTQFRSYAEALRTVENTNFKIEETLNTSRSSWIRGASFYSCDGIVGYLIIGTDKQEYIHKNVPIEVWNRFKRANSFGSYYNQYIKGRYRLNLSF